MSIGDHGSWAAAINHLGVVPVGVSEQPLVPGTVGGFFFSFFSSVFIAGVSRDVLR